jgi:hypothetical protein
MPITDKERKLTALSRVPNMPINQDGVKRFVDLVTQGSTNGSDAEHQHTTKNQNGVPVTVPGDVGEYLETVLPFASGVTAAASPTGKTICSRVFTPGDWDIWGAIGVIPVAATSITRERGAISNLTNSTPSNAQWNCDSASHAAVTGATTGRYFALPTKRLLITVNTTQFLTAAITYTGTAPKLYGFIAGRRRR